MNQVKEIIQSVLDEHRGTCENEELATKCTAKLTEATIKEAFIFFPLDKSIEEYLIFLLFIDFIPSPFSKVTFL